MSQNEGFLVDIVLPFLLIGLPVLIVLVAYLILKREWRNARMRSVTDPSEAPTTLVPCPSGSGRVQLHTPRSYDSFILDILIRSFNGEYIIAAAALDTQCQGGNWITERLIKDLGLMDFVHHEYGPYQVITATGEEVESCGSIDLVWKLAQNKNRVYRERFSVLSNVRHWDVILGQDTINKEQILSANSHKLFATLTTLKGLNQSDNVAIAALKAQQQQDKKRLEARRQAQQQQQQQQQQSPNQSSN